MARIISDTYEKGEKSLWDLNPDSLNNQEFNRKIVAVNDMYGWLYEKGILRDVSFEFKDYSDMSYFALDVKDLEPYRAQMEQSGLKDSSLAISHIFDKEYTPCIYSGAIQLGWTMLTYRDAGGNVVKSWETEIVKHLSGEAAHEVSSLRKEKGIKAAVSKVFKLYDFEPDLFDKACVYYQEYVDLSCKENQEFFNVHADKLIYCHENKKDMLDFDFWVQYEELLGEKITWDEYVAIDREFDGDPHDVDEKDTDIISGFRNSLNKHRDIIVITLDDKIASADKQKGEICYTGYPSLEKIKSDYTELMDKIKDIRTVAAAKEFSDKFSIVVEINGVSIDEFLRDGGTDQDIEWIRYEAYGCLSYVYDRFDGKPMFDVGVGEIEDRDYEFITDITIDDLTKENYTKWVKEDMGTSSPTRDDGLEM